MPERTSIQIDKDTHKRLRLLSVKTGKKLYELIMDSILLLEEKYRDQM
jgi:hypothetical protein